VKLVANLIPLLLLAGCVVHRIAPEGGVAPLATPSPTAKIVVSKVGERSEGHQCFEPLLYVLTLGIVPARCVDTYTASTEAESSEVHVMATYKIATVQGWLSLLLAPAPEWRLGGSKAPQAEIESFIRAAGK
jgi:hypothetical protein